MATKFELTLFCQRCGAKAQLNRLARGQSEGKCLKCAHEMWKIAGMYEKTDTDYHVAENAIGIGLAAVIGIGYTVSPSTTGYYKEFELADISAKRVVKFLAARSPDAIMQLIEVISEARYQARVEKYMALCETHGVHCFECQKPFLPGTVLALSKLVEEGRYTHNCFCSAACENKSTEIERERVCRRCYTDFVEPMETAIKLVGPRPWHREGYCSDACQKAKKKQACMVCHKLFQVSSLNYLPIHQEVIRVQEAGFCSTTCHEKNPEATPIDPQTFQKREKAEMLRAACEQGHETDIPPSHHGLYYFCFECKTPKAVPA